MDLYKCKVLCEYRDSYRGRIKTRKVDVLIDSKDAADAMTQSEKFCEDQMPIGPLYVGFTALSAAKVRLPAFFE